LMVGRSSPTSRTTPSHVARPCLRILKNDKLLASLVGSDLPPTRCMPTCSSTSTPSAGVPMVLVAGGRPRSRFLGAVRARGPAYIHRVASRRPIEMVVRSCAKLLGGSEQPWRWNPSAHRGLPTPAIGRRLAPASGAATPGPPPRRVAPRPTSSRWRRWSAAPARALPLVLGPPPPGSVPPSRSSASEWRSVRAERPSKAQQHHPSRPAKYGPQRQGAYRKEPDGPAPAPPVADDRALELFKPLRPVVEGGFAGQRGPSSTIPASAPTEGHPPEEFDKGPSKDRGGPGPSRPDRPVRPGWRRRPA